MADREHISCKEIVELVNDYLDQMRTTISTVGRITEEQIPAETRDKLLTAFRDWKRT